MGKFQVVSWMVELENGITKEQILKMLEKLPNGAEVMPFSASENNSSAYGFITAEAFEEIDFDEEYLKDFLNPILNDWANESPDKEYVLPNGMKMYMGCDYETILL